MVCFHYITIPVFNQTLIMGYSTLFTFLPILSIVLDNDITKNKLFQFP